MSLRSKVIVAVVLFLLVADVLGLWLLWESYKCTVNWSKRKELFPLPFYIVSLPHWFVVDLAILIDVVCTTVLAYLAISCRIKDCKAN